MSGEERKVGFVVHAENQTQQTFDEIKRDGKDTAGSLEQSGRRMQKALTGVGDGGDQASKKLDGSTKSIISSIQRATAAAEAGEKGTAKYFEVIGRQRNIGGDVLEPYLAQLRKAEAAQAAASASMGNLGMSSKATAAAMRGVPAQLSDIFVSLQGGMPVMTVFTQQGLQLRDMFHGFVPAIKAVGTAALGMVNPFTVAAAAAAAFGLAYYQGSKESDAFVRAIALSGNAAGVTTNQLREYAREMSDVVGSQSKAAAGLTAFVEAGVRGRDELKRYSATAVEWEKLTGEAVDKTADKFASLQRDPLAGVLKLNQGTNFLTVSVYEQIKALDEQGRKADASKVAMDALDAAMRDRSKTIKENLGVIEAGWAAIKRVASGAWDAMLNVGRQATVADQLAEVRQKLATEQRRMDGANRASFGGSASTKAEAARIQAEVAALKAQETQLIATMQAEEKAAAAKAEGNRVMQAREDFDRKYQKALEGELSLKQKLDAARREAEGAGKSEADIKKVLAYVTEEHNKSLKKGEAAQKAYNRELAQQQALIGELSGLSSDFYQEWDKLSKAYSRGAMSLGQLEEKQAALLAKQPFMVKIAKDEADATKLRVKAYEDDQKAQEKLIEQREEAAKQAEGNLQKARDEEEAYALAADSGITLAEAVAKIALARAEDNYQKAASQGTDGRTLLALQREIEARRELLEVMGQRGVREANKKAADEAAKDWERTSKTISDTLADYIMAGGKDAAQYLKRLFATLILQPTVQTFVGGIMGQGGAAGAMTGGGIVDRLANSGGGLTNWSSWGTGGADWLWENGASAINNGWTELGGSMMDLGRTVGQVDTWLRDIPGFGGGIGSAAGYLGAFTSLANGKPGAALGQGIGTYLLPGIGTLIGGFLGGMLDGLDGSGDMHRGGTSAWSSAQGLRTSVSGLDNVDNQFLTGMGYVEYDKGTQDSVSGVAQAVGTALDGFARAFGDKAGYEVATAWADDWDGKGSSWGALRIARDGEELLNWDDGRSSKWAPREFGSNKEEGYQEYLAAVAKDTRQVLLDMDLPSWADQILESIGDSADMSALTAAMTQIGAIKTAFEGLGNTMAAFRGLSGEMQTALLGAAGSMDALVNNAASFYQGFYSEAERMEALRGQLSDALGDLQLTIDPTLGDDAKAQFRAAVQAAMDAGNAQLATSLLAMSGNFASAADYFEQAAEEQARAAESIRVKEEDLQIQLLRAQGNELAAVAIERRREIDALAQFGPAAQDIQRHIWSIIDATAQLQAGADAYFADVDRNAAEQGYVNDAQSALDKIFGSVNAGAQAAAQAQASAAQAAASSWRSAASSIQSSLDKLRADTTADMDPAARLSLTRAQLGAYTTAALGGDADAASKMASAADAFLQASDIGSISRVDYLRDRITAEAQLASVLQSSEAKASMQESIAAAANASVSELQELNANLTGFAGGLYELLSKGYQGADRGAAQTVAQSFAKMQADYDAYFNDLAGFGAVGNKYTDASFNGASFTKLGNNMAAFTGADGIVSYIRAGESLVEVAKRIPELRALWEKNYGIKLPAFAEGGYHAGGLRVVGERGWEIEATGPARIWNQQQIASAMRGGDNGSAQVVQALQTVSAQIARLEQRLAAIEDSNDQMATQQDNSTDGGNAQRAEIMNVKQLAQAIKEAMA